jgi:hypothetical protein
MLNPLPLKLFWWILLLLGLFVLAFLNSYGATVPKAPRRPVVPLRSPKDAASQPARALVVISPGPFTNRFKLVWDYPATNLATVAFIVEYRTNLSRPWQVLGRVTNATEFPRATTNRQEFFRVGAFLK